MSRYDVIALGNAIVDVLSQVPDSFLSDNKLTKGQMTLIDDDVIKAHLYQEMEKLSGLHLQAGGSAANTIETLASLGHKTDFIGKVGNDEMGRSFAEDLHKLGVDFKTPPLQNDVPTARCSIFITPDAERTMVTAIDAAKWLSVADIDADAIKNAKILYLEGYLWNAENTKEAMRKAMQIAKESGVKIAFSLSDPFCVHCHRAEFMPMIRENVSILFSNEEELKSLYLAKDIADAVTKIRKDCPMSVVTLGEKGALCVLSDKEIRVNAEVVDKVIDTTGAGDQFAAGFLSAYLKGDDVENCLKNGAKFAAQIIQKVGARL